MQVQQTYYLYQADSYRKAANAKAYPRTLSPREKRQDQQCSSQQVLFRRPSGQQGSCQLNLL